MVSLVFGAAAYAGTFLLPLQYASEVRILVRPSDIQAPFVQDLIPPFRDRYDGLKNAIQSRTSMLGILAKLELYGDMELDRRVERLRQGFTLSFGEPSVIVLRYVAPDPTIAQKVATALTRALISQDAQGREHRIQTAREFFQGELDRVGERLVQQRDRLAQSRGQEPDPLLAMDYEASQSWYRSLATRLEEIETITMLDAQQRAEGLVVVEQPNLPLAPLPPNRTAFAGLGAMTGLVLGGTAMLGLHRRRRRPPA